MATFPTGAEKIFTLGQNVSRGFKENEDLYPAPPVAVEDLDKKLEAYEKARGAAVAAQAAAERATADKSTAMQVLVDDLKLELRYAEMAVNFDDAKLKTIGWGGRREKTPLAAPGRALNLTIKEEGESWIALAWEKPTDGGKVASYEVERRERVVGSDYRTVGATTATEVILTDQERGTEFEYVVVAINRSGRGPISNAVTVVL